MEILAFNYFFLGGGRGVFLWQLKEVTICMNEHGHFYL